MAKQGTTETGDTLTGNTSGKTSGKWVANLPVLAAPSREGENRRTVREGFWPKLRGYLARIPFAEEAVAGYYAAMDPATPRRTKLLLLAALAYLIAPADAVPDFLLGLGFTDDATVFWATWKLVQDKITPIHRKKAQEALAALKQEAEGHRVGGEPRP